MVPISRRRFLSLASHAGMAAFLSACSVDLPSLLGTAQTDDPSAIKGPLLQNEDRQGFFIRWYKPFYAPDPASWSLTLEGELDNPLTLTMKDIQELAHESQTSRLRCVDGWSVAAHWEGIRFPAVFELVKPREGVTWLHFTCADDYEEALKVEEVMSERVMLADGMNDAPLTSEHGAPLRLIVPAKYGYKGPKAITKIEFKTSAGWGTWPSRGSYTIEGDIGAGMDVPLDLSAPRVIQNGEIFYPDGLEAEDMPAPTPTS